MVHKQGVKIHDPLKVTFYQTESGNEPVREWLLEKVTEEERKIIGKDIKVVQFSWPIGMLEIPHQTGHQFRSKSATDSV